MLTGRCYCGAVHITASSDAQSVVHCHCLDCRRWTGAAVATFAALPAASLEITPDPSPISHAEGVKRWFCRECGTPLAARFDYLPDQVYVPIGILNEADALKPELHSHVSARLPWLHLDDDLPEFDGSSRAELTAKSG